MHFLAQRFVFWGVNIGVFWKREPKPIKWRQCRLLTRFSFVCASIVYGRHPPGATPTPGGLQPNLIRWFYSSFLLVTLNTPVSFPFEHLGRLWRSVRCPETRRQMDVSRNHVMGHRVCRGEPSGGLHKNPHVQELDRALHKTLISFFSRWYLLLNNGVGNVVPSKPLWYIYCVTCDGGKIGCVIVLNVTSAYFFVWQFDFCVLKRIFIRSKLES